MERISSIDTSGVSSLSEKESDRPRREILLHSVGVESSAVDKFNDVSLYSQLPGLEYLKIPDQIYTRTARVLSRRFSYKNLFKSHYDTVMDDRSVMGRLLSM